MKVSVKEIKKIIIDILKEVMDPSQDPLFGIDQEALEADLGPTPRSQNRPSPVGRATRGPAAAIPPVQTGRKPTSAMPVMPTRRRGRTSVPPVPKTRGQETWLSGGSAAGEDQRRRQAAVDQGLYTGGPGSDRRDASGQSMGSPDQLTPQGVAAIRGRTQEILSQYMQELQRNPNFRPQEPQPSGQGYDIDYMARRDAVRQFNRRMFGLDGRGPTPTGEPEIAPDMTGWINQIANQGVQAVPMGIRENHIREMIRQALREMNTVSSEKDTLKEMVRNIVRQTLKNR